MGAELRLCVRHAARRLRRGVRPLGKERFPDRPFQKQRNDPVERSSLPNWNASTTALQVTVLTPRASFPMPWEAW